VLFKSYFIVVHLRNYLSSLVFLLPGHKFTCTFYVIELDSREQILILSVWPRVSEEAINKVLIIFDLIIEALRYGRRKIGEYLLYLLCLHQEIAPLDLVIEERFGQIGKLGVQLVNRLYIY
jgi:hypothetical protein